MFASSHCAVPLARHCRKMRARHLAFTPNKPSQLAAMNGRQATRQTRRDTAAAGVAHDATAIRRAILGKVVMVEASREKSRLRKRLDQTSVCPLLVAAGGGPTDVR